MIIIIYNYFFYKINTYIIIYIYFFLYILYTRFFYLYILLFCIYYKYLYFMTKFLNILSTILIHLMIIHLKYTSKIEFSNTILIY